MRGNRAACLRRRVTGTFILCVLLCVQENSGMFKLTRSEYYKNKWNRL